jgi:hypothetical protein
MRVVNMDTNYNAGFNIPKNRPVDYHNEGATKPMNPPKEKETGKSFKQELEKSKTDKPSFKSDKPKSTKSKEGKAEQGESSSSTLLSPLLVLRGRDASDGLEPDDSLPIVEETLPADEEVPVPDMSVEHMLFPYIPLKDMPVKDMPVKDMPVKDMPVPDMSVKDIPVKDMPAKDMPVKDMPVKDMPVKDMPVKDMPVPDMPVKDIPVKDMPVPDMPVKDIPVKDMPVPDMPVKDIPVKDMPAKDMPVKDIPVKDMPAKDMPVKDMPVKDMPVKDMPVKDMPVKDMPVKDMPVKDMPVKDMPAKDMPVKDMPVKDMPVKDMPVYEKAAAPVLRPLQSLKEGDAILARNALKDETISPSDLFSQAASKVNQSSPEIKTEVKTEVKPEGIPPTPMQQFAPATDSSNIAPVQRPALQEIIDKIVDKVYTLTLEGKGQTDTVITLKNPPILEGATIAITSFDTAKGELNLSFNGLSPEARNLLDTQQAKESLKSALQEKGYAVHIISMSNEPLATARTESEGARQEKGDREQEGQGGGGQGGKKGRDEERG